MELRKEPLFASVVCGLCAPLLNLTLIIWGFKAKTSFAKQAKAAFFLSV